MGQGPVQRQYRRLARHVVEMGVTASCMVVELRFMLERSQLQGWRIVEDLMDVMVVKEAQRCRSWSGEASGPTAG